MITILKNNFITLPIRKFIFDTKFANDKNVNYFRGVFNSFQEAQASSPKTKPVSYNNLDAAQMYLERTQKLYSTDYPVLFWMEKIKNNFATVFDFGGHVGVHYYSYQKALCFSKIDRWTVCDVEMVCQEGERIARVKDNLGKLSFVDDIKKCEGHDLFIANGSLQYLEWELHEKLEEVSYKPKYIIVNMTPLHPSIRTKTLNNIGTSFCPYYIRKEDDFFKGLRASGYEIIDTWSNETKSCSIAFEPERSISYYRGAILKLKSE
jgi:putative methyltransferase (TIGR04325 family)